MAAGYRPHGRRVKGAGAESPGTHPAWVKCGIHKTHQGWRLRHVVYQGCGSSQFKTRTFGGPPPCSARRLPAHAPVNPGGFRLVAERWEWLGSNGGEALGLRSVPLLSATVVRSRGRVDHGRGPPCEQRSTPMPVPVLAVRPDAARRTSRAHVCHVGNTHVPPVRRVAPVPIGEIIVSQPIDIVGWPCNACGSCLRNWGTAIFPPAL
jgi:hypothetical protein